MRGFDHAKILSPSFHARNAWHNDLPFVSQKFRGGGYFQKNWEGVCSTLLETLTLFQTKICDFLYPISDLKPWSRRVTGARDKLLRHVHGSGRKH